MHPVGPYYTNKLSFYIVYSALQQLTSQRNNIKLIRMVCGVVLSIIIVLAQQASEACLFVVMLTA
jgi:hypothetical protein